MNNKENKSQNKIASQIHPQLPTSLSSKPKTPNTLASFKEAFLNLHQKRQTTQNSYEKVISALEEIVEELCQKNDCLSQEKQSLVKDNYQLRKQTQSLTSIIQVKKRLGESIVLESSDIFEILVQSNTVQRGLSKQEESYQCGNTIGNILEENSCIANRQEFIIMSNPLSQNISRLEQSQISMSNIGRTQQVNPTSLQTPGLHRENIFVQCSSKTSQGIIRAFYLSVMQKKSTARHLIEVLESLKHDITFTIFEPYPTNEFWIQMLCNFLKLAHDGSFDSQFDVLEYIKQHRLIDTLMIKCLKSRVEFLFCNMDSFQIPSTTQILGALANEFCLRLQIVQDQYIFYTKEVREENLLCNTDRASLQISLNNKDSNVYYVKEEEPCFTIMERQDFLQFTFFILVECQLGISQYEINQESLGKGDQQSFRIYESNNESFKIGDRQFELNFGGEHLDGVVSVLNQRDQNLEQMQQKKLRRKYGHKRYTQATPKQQKQPLNSSRFFMNRVASKHSSEESV